MGMLELFLQFHQGRGIPDRPMDRLFDVMSEEQLRCRPHPVVNSIAWIVWHISRAEDGGVNRFVMDLPQVLDEGDWGRRMNMVIRHHGGGMSDAEVTELSQCIDLPALRGYYNAVRARTVEVVKTLTAEQIDEIPDSRERRRIIDAEGWSKPITDPNRLPYKDWTRGELLVHLALTHSYGHYYEACTVCSLLGIPFWQ
jgi:hypothetical protein